MTTKDKLDGIQVIAENQVPPYRTHHSPVYEAVDAVLRTLPKGKAIQVNCDQLKIRAESVRNHVYTEVKEGRLPKDLRVTCRSTSNGHFCFIVRPSKGVE